jgi:hypothetical protein
MVNRIWPWGKRKRAPDRFRSALRLTLVERLEYGNEGLLRRIFLLFALLGAFTTAAATCKGGSGDKRSAH